MALSGDCMTSENTVAASSRRLVASSCARSGVATHAAATIIAIINLMSHLPFIRTLALSVRHARGLLELRYFSANPLEPGIVVSTKLFIDRAKGKPVSGERTIGLLLEHQEELGFLPI